MIQATSNATNFVFGLPKVSIPDCFLAVRMGDDFDALGHLARYAPTIAFIPHQEAGCVAYANTPEASASSWLLQPMYGDHPVCFPSALIRWAWEITSQGDGWDGEIRLAQIDETHAAIYVRNGEQWGYAHHYTRSKSYRPYRANFDGSRRLWVGSTQLIYALKDCDRVLQLQGRSTTLKVGDQKLRVRPGRLGAPPAFKVNVDRDILKHVLFNLPLLDGDAFALSVGDNCLVISSGGFEVVIPILVPNNDNADDIARPFLPLLWTKLRIENAIADAELANNLIAWRAYKAARQTVLLKQWQDALVKLSEIDTDDSVIEARQELMKLKPLIQHIQQKTYLEPNEINQFADPLVFAAEVHECFQRSHWMYAF